MPSGFATSDPLSTFFTPQDAVDFVFPVFLLSVLGLNTLQTSSMMARRAPLVPQASLRVAGIGLAFAGSLAFLALTPFLMHATAPHVPTFTWSGILEGGVNFPALVFFTGGSILIYETVKEISHILSLDYLGDDFKAPSPASPRAAFAAVPTGQHVADFSLINRGLPKASSVHKLNSKRAAFARLRD